MCRDLERERHCGWHSRRFDDRVEAATLRQVGGTIVEITRRRIKGRYRPEVPGHVAPPRLRFDHNHAGVVGRGDKQGQESDRPSAQDSDGIARIDAAETGHRAVRNAQRFHERRLRVRQRLRDLVEPLGLDLEQLRRGAADVEPEVVPTTGSHDTFADDAIAGKEAGDRRSDLHDLAGPLVPGDDRVGEGDDVAPFEEFEVGVADSDGV